ncbi:murein transglycosylase A [Swaminathania salitolerans]|uniref:peptidoglycan lytic exotransglycosylase n=1 Tax=Swaminathania salitolerans TaxID=182838 RepID=A0A511BMM5_9PROT|nr:MltA domain-containing protein [Swaminathania salitolerans]GBQ15861.1 membrane-bound lytic murein transglycosylase [Swaminathania salitolerans LMG 21291]GEL01515.1 murein transglycosylase [Swaminathania salitolerans]
MKRQALRQWGLSRMRRSLAFPRALALMGDIRAHASLSRSFQYSTCLTFRKMMKTVYRPSLALCLALLTSCAAPRTPDDVRLEPVAYATLPNWSSETVSAVMPQLRAECQKLSRLPPETVLGGKAGQIPNGSRAGDWSGACQAIRSVGGGEAAARAYIEQWFAPYLVSDTALFTGYYEPQVVASPTREGAFRIPLYGQPSDLVRTKDTAGNWVTGRWKNGAFVPYYSRAEIDGGALDGKGLELAWLRSPEDLFFLQVQGSGRLVMTNGSVRRVGFAAKNGHPYVPIGRVLVQRGEMAARDVSLSSLRGWLSAHPGEARSVMEENPDYVFFRRIDTIPLDRGAPGAMGVPLTPGRSVAVDRDFLPLGAPVWIDTQIPVRAGGEGRWSHLTLAQDVGSGIHDAARADLFTGWGDEAEFVAGGLRHRGRMVVLLPHPPA